MKGKYFCPLPPSMVPTVKDIAKLKIPSRKTCHLLGTTVPPLLIRIILNSARKVIKPIDINRLDCVNDTSSDPRNKGTNGINSNCSNGLVIMLFLYEY